MNRWVWLGVMLFAFLMGSYYAYSLGYSHAKGHYEDEMMYLRMQHTEQLKQALKMGRD